MPDDPPILALLWLLAGILLFSMCVPPLFHLLGLSRYQIEVLHSANESEPGDEIPYTAKLVRQLQELEMKPIGELTETVNFFVIHWSWSCRQRIFGAKERQAFAVLYRLVEGEPIRLAFVTCFEDGAMVWTGNHSEDIQMLSPDHVRWGRATDDLTELLRLHHEAAERLGGGERRPVAHDNLAELARTLEPHSRRHLTMNKQVPLTFLVLSLAVGGVVPYFVGRSLGFDSPWVPLAVILEGILYWLFHTRTLVSLVAKQRQAEVQGR